MDMHWWVQEILKSAGPVALVSWVFWVIFSICLHELGHGVAALSQGDDTPRVTGHMTMNPLVHMGKASLILFAVVGFAWGMMPVNPRKFRNGPLGEVIVAGAGPLVNLILALLTLTGYGMLIAYARHHHLDPQQVGWLSKTLTILWYGGSLNMILLVLNLIPLPPLDGSRILAGIIPAARNLYANPQLLSLSFAGILAIFLFGSEYIFSISNSITQWWAGLIVHLLA